MFREVFTSHFDIVVLASGITDKNSDVISYLAPPFVLWPLHDGLESPLLFFEVPAQSFSFTSALIQHSPLVSNPFITVVSADDTTDLSNVGTRTMSTQ